jgi:peptidoglycan-N-acetylglucosamine deacetylase
LVKVLVGLLILGGCGARLQAKEIALTFEKLPFMEPLGYWTPREISNLVLRALEARDVRAMGFVMEEKIDDRPESYVVLQDWVARGHSLGNGTYSYVDLNQLSARDFLDHVRDGRKHTRRATHGTGVEERYFRFPLLHEGNTAGKKRDVAGTLRRAGYVVVPATVLVEDYQFNHFLEEADSSEDGVERLRALYLEHLGASLDYAETQAEVVLNGPVKHILRLHLGTATGRFLPDLLRFLEERGYSFVSVKEALADPAYQTEEDYVGPLGLGFIDRVAATRGLPFDPDMGRISRDEIAARLREE